VGKTYKYNMESTIEKIARIYLVRLNGGGKYTGVTTNSIEKRWTQHCYAAKVNKTKSVLHAAIRKYGAGAFTTEELYQSTDLEHTLNVKEMEFIVEHKTHVSEGGYNLTLGGEGMAGHVPSEETRKKMSLTRKGRRFSEDHRRKISKANTGKVRSDEAKQKMSLHGKSPSKETRQKISKAGKGRVHSDESKQKMSKAKKGKPILAETRLKMSEAKRGRIIPIETRRKMAESQKLRRLRQVSPPL